MTLGSTPTFSAPAPRATSISRNESNSGSSSRSEFAKQLHNASSESDESSSPHEVAAPQVKPPSTGSSKSNPAGAKGERKDNRAQNTAAAPQTSPDDNEQSPVAPTIAVAPTPPPPALPLELHLPFSISGDSEPAGIESKKEAPHRSGFGASMAFLTGAESMRRASLEAPTTAAPAMATTADAPAAMPSIVLPAENVEPEANSAGTSATESVTPQTRGKAEAPDETLPAAGAKRADAVQTAGSSQEMAFAARVKAAQNPTQGDANGQWAQQAQEISAAASGGKKAVAADGAQSLRADAPAAPQAIIAAFEQNGKLSNGAIRPEAAEVPRAEQLHPEPPQQAAKPAGQLKDISLQVTQPSNEKVDIRLVQQQGELRVAVHTGDFDLAHGLRQGLPELVGKLQSNGFQTETWRPGAAAAVATSSATETGNESNSSRNGDPQSQSGGQPQDQQGQQNHKQSNRPRWVEEMQSSLRGGRVKGDFNGFSN